MYRFKPVIFYILFACLTTALQLTLEHFSTSARWCTNMPRWRQGDSPSTCRPSWPPVMRTTSWYQEPVVSPSPSSWRSNLWSMTTTWHPRTTAAAQCRRLWPPQCRHRGWPRRGRQRRPSPWASGGGRPCSHQLSPAPVNLHSCFLFYINQVQGRMVHYRLVLKKRL